MTVLVTNATSDKTRLLEIFAVLMTVAGKFIFMDWLSWRLPFILVVSLGWLTYVIVRGTRNKILFQHWGFRADNFGRAARLVALPAIVAVVSLFFIGYLRGTLNLNWHMLIVLLIYPLWGIVQQFLVIAIVAGNLQDMQRKRFNRTLIIILTAALFGVVHYPWIWLMLGTFLLALFYGYIFIRERNVYVLGIFHGWLAAIIFYTVVGRDPWVEVFGRL